jgi:hypothetical protein
MSEFSADVEEILASSREMRELMHLGQQMTQKFLDGTSRYKGWWGEPGADEFANAVGPQVEQTEEAFTGAVGAVDAVPKGLVEAFGVEAAVVKGSQEAALEDIQSQGGGSDDVRR